MSKKNNETVKPEIDFTARAFGEDPVVETKESSSEAPTADASQAESGEIKEATSGAAPVVEQEVPYSRLRKAIEQRREAEAKADEANRRYEDLQRTRTEASRTYEPYEVAIANRIKKLYGDNETSKEIIEIEIARSKEIEAIAERKANEAFEKRESSSRSQIEVNERAVEGKLEDFSLTIGRDLTPDEEDRLLTIADKYSPVGEDGKYLSGEPLPLDRAWEIYEMELASQGQASKKSRSVATALTSSKTEGETTTESGDTDNWYPGRWRDRLGKK